MGKRTMNASRSLAYSGWLIAPSSLITRVFHSLAPRASSQVTASVWFAASRKSFS